MQITKKVEKENIEPELKNSWQICKTCEGTGFLYLQASKQGGIKKTKVNKKLLDYKFRHNLTDLDLSNQQNRSCLDCIEGIDAKIRIPIERELTDLEMQLLRLKAIDEIDYNKIAKKLNLTKSQLTQIYDNIQSVLHADSYQSMLNYCIYNDIQNHRKNYLSFEQLNFRE